MLQQLSSITIAENGEQASDIIGFLLVIDGYITLPSGLIIQWRYFTKVGNYYHTINWPFTRVFKESCFWAFATAIANADKDEAYRGYMREKPTATEINLTSWGANDYIAVAIGY